jgi:4-hydroxythreonine-4-phosphate dehydrogenase
MKPSVKQILITTGDSDGVGFEVSAKALLHLRRGKNRLRGVSFVLFLPAKTFLPFEKNLLTKLRSAFTTTEVFTSEKSLFPLLESFSAQSQLTILYSSASPAEWVEQAAIACLRGFASAMVTAPLSKPAIREAGFKDLGHTEILQRICKSKSPNMCFLGSHFNVVLATGHLPLERVPQALNEKVISQAIERACKLLPFLPRENRKKPMGILGLNPHAGDKSLIGDFEKKTLSPLLKKLTARGLKVEGPLVPDAAFHPEAWKKYSFYISLYHDQGLIPFKMAHGFDSGVHLTLGLPICRTSVDHGTAKNIYGKNKANSGSMQDALQWAIRFGT